MNDERWLAWAVGLMVVAVVGSGAFVGLDYSRGEARPCLAVVVGRHYRPARTWTELCSSIDPDGSLRMETCTRHEDERQFPNPEAGGIVHARPPPHPVGAGELVALLHPRPQQRVHGLGLHLSLDLIEQRPPRPSDCCG